MSYFVGSVWAGIFLILAIVSIVFAVWSLLYKKIILGVVFLLFLFGSLYMSYFAASHFRVAVNERALVVNQIKGEIVGVRESGVQPKPIVGAKIFRSPSNKVKEVFLDLGPGTASASASNGTALWVDVRLYVDTSQMDLESAYLAVNGDWEKFLSSYLMFQLTDIVRETSHYYDVSGHNDLRSDWEQRFERNVKEFFSEPDNGFGLAIVPGRSTMSWDFVNEKDAIAFDDARRAQFLVDKRNAELEAVKVESQIAEERAGILVKTSSGATTAWTDVAEFINGQPEEIRAFLIAYMGLQSDLEYLRLVGQNEPNVFFPPGSSPVVTYDTSQASVSTSDFSPEPSASPVE